MAGRIQLAVDSSVAVKWFSEEEKTKEAVALRDAHVKGYGGLFFMIMVSSKHPYGTCISSSVITLTMFPSRLKCLSSESIASSRWRLAAAT